MKEKPKDKHPLNIVYDHLDKDEILNEKLSNYRKDDSYDYNMIFTFEIGEEYQKSELSPFLRFAPITMQQGGYSDGYDSQYYELYFSLEIFTELISQGYDLAGYIIDKYKKDLNCICYAQDLQFDEKHKLYNTFLRFKIIVEKGEF